MNYCIRQLESITILGTSTKSKIQHIEEAALALWKEITSNGALNKIHEVKVLDGVFEGRVVAYLQESIDQHLTYSIGIEYKQNASNYPLEAITIPKNRWVCFKFIGPVPESITKAKIQIMDEYVPKLNITIREDSCIEVYSNNDRTSKYYPFEIWYPLDE